MALGAENRSCGTKTNNILWLCQRHFSLTKFISATLVRHKLRQLTFTYVNCIFGTFLRTHNLSLVVLAYVNIGLTSKIYTYVVMTIVMIH